MELDTIERVARLIAEHRVAEIEIADGGGRLRITRRMGAADAVLTTQAQNTVLADPQPGWYSSDESEPQDDGSAATILVTAELVGLFRHASPTIQFGNILEEGELLGSIEAMKLANDIRSPAAGRVVEVMIEESAPVEYGQPLFRIDTA